MDKIEKLEILKEINSRKFAYELLEKLSFKNLNFSELFKTLNMKNNNDLGRVLRYLSGKNFVTKDKLGKYELTENGRLGLEMVDFALHGNYTCDLETENNEKLKKRYHDLIDKISEIQYINGIYKQVLFQSSDVVFSSFPVGI